MFDFLFPSSQFYFFPIFAESDDSTNHYKACFPHQKNLVGCLRPVVCGNRNKHVFGVQTCQGPFRDGLSG